jgi:hypothetical protein
MPWYSARSLLEVRPKIGHPVNEALLRSLLEDFLGALEAYHRVGGMHGGLSPSKVLLLDDDRGLLLGPSATGHATRLAPHDATSQPSDTAFASVEQRTAEVNAQPQGPWTDFYTLAAIVRFWITGLLPPVPKRGPPEPLTATIGRQFVGQPVMPYSEGLLRALDAAMSVDINKRPQSAAQFRRWLAQSPSQASATQGTAAPGSLMPSSPSPPAASQVHGILPASDTRSIQAKVGATGGPEDEEVDAATVDAIRRMIASIPDTSGHAPVRPGQDGPPTILGQPRMAAAGVAASATAATPGPRSRPRVRTRVGLLMAAAALVAIAAWQIRPWLNSGVQSDQTLAHAPPVEPADEPAGLSPVPSAPTDSLTTPPAVQVVPSAASPPVVMEPAPEPTEQDAPASRPPQPSMPPATGRAKELVAGSPRALCGARTEFSLYRCMQQQCSQARWQRHSQCLHLRATDTVE